MRNIYDLKREIQDLKNVRDVIATLERISASYIPALRSHLEILEEYAEGNRRIFRKLGAKQTDVQEDDDISQSLVVVFSTDHGLVGGLNSRLIERVVEHVRDNPKDHVIVFGEKGKDLMRISGIHPAAIFSALTDKPSIDELREFFDQFFSTSDIAYRRVTVLAPRFVSVLEQSVEPSVVWPVYSDHNGGVEAGHSGTVEEQPNEESYAFVDPSGKRVAEFLIARMVRLTMYEKALGAKLSEHAARMTAMADAGKSAGKIVSNLEHQYFKARQYTITKRLSEVFSAKQSLKLDL
ncbi:hypothetical protein A2841_00120 [Candidatus Kaiserbacteria bacterium RIFCSPHIGHO2_01_FULL_48_10]|uniref:ATP synthase gamma chain n=1 Tax=Candidatus Kaiserbacteria bacterium RIFCSPHIGHO2_01_FULL_48_10 TaxID=1798476 RepID=A0A1F6C5U0_9BACT|nr:MAG: hypothetical protein A2841_00120 [Candidatus Kaiserbacteria bacterium RIFCSPHIGHO2_01_FULL_48_10]